MFSLPLAIKLILLISGIMYFILGKVECIKWIILN